MMKLEEIAELLSGRIEGLIEKEITGVGKIETAGSSEITFISNPQYEKYFKTTNAGAIIISNEFELKTKRNDLSIIRVEDPYLSFLKLLEKFEEGKVNEQNGISEYCFTGENCELGENVYLGNYVSIGNNCTVGMNTKIYSNSTLESNTIVGNNCIIYPNVSIYKNCIIGNNVIIHSGTVIGSDGFGFAKQEDGTYKKIPQTGNVVIEDNVEIGSNCSIDRATLGETKICRGVKLDNQIQIAHNVFIDENTVIAAQVGIAGSTKIGKRCMIGGQSGLVGHITICDDVIIGASVGVPKSIDKPGIYTGYRARPLKETLRLEVGMQNIRKLEDRVKELEKKLSK
ncbi:MAG: UDP-3-O-(3-hydroxymyristoyl)glucosamine N-acyltransferase [Ignavibacteria bacterium]|nr:UDP-3-O-(3-hydroxymyristoyl)glucosamine N-acyltransferase [Ignavibacteria bacterium]